MPNRLGHENSPYLLQHAENPVDWFPWGDEAIEIAKNEDKPIFLSIGYAACHWCHVMAHESFEDLETASIMNQYFINIKVDREERPDLDNIYMNAVVALTGRGGWPMSVFLTPEGQPFFGGTYFPPVRRYNMSSFKEVLLNVARIWREDRSQLLRSSAQLTEYLKTSGMSNEESQEFNEVLLDDSAMRLSQSYDWEYGGWGKAPKFPQPMVIEFLLRRASRGDRQALDLSIHALNSMAKGGMYDVIGGGFARYSTDDNWLVPHFEKMLYDNAQLSRIYLHAFLITGDEKYRKVCENTLDFIIRELRDYSHERPSGGFFSSLDADSEGVEGKYYVWSSKELQHEINSANLEDEYSENIDWFEIFRDAYDITEKGNFEGEIILQQITDDETLSKKYNLPVHIIQNRLSLLHSHLLKVREQRIRPGLDDKILVSWNALALISFSEAARYLNRLDYLEVAIDNAEFLLSELLHRNHLLRSWRNGSARHNAYLEDYGGLILGLLSLYQSNPDVRWFNTAFQLGKELIIHFRDPDNGFFDTRDDQDTLIIRPKNLQDNATPSGNALAAMALLQLSAYNSVGEWRDLAEKILRSVVGSVVKYPLGYAKWLCAIDFAVFSNKEIAVLGSHNHPRTKELVDVLWSNYRPDYIAAISSFPPPPDSPSLLSDRTLLNDKPTAYVCRNFICNRPLNSPKELAQQLDL